MVRELEKEKAEQEQKEKEEAKEKEEEKAANLCRTLQMVDKFASTTTHRPGVQVVTECTLVEVEGAQRPTVCTSMCMLRQEPDKLHRHQQHRNNMLVIRTRLQMLFPVHYPQLH